MDTGELAPDFELPDQDGVPRKLTTLLAEGGPVVLFFYPAAMSPGCTAESCHFRDLAKEFAAVGAQRIGISNDRVEVQSEFAGRHNLDYPLLSDLDGTVAAEYGVKRRLGPLAVKRHTFVIDVDRRVLAVVRSELRMSVHADKALEVLRNRNV
ncbi:peroxiredoxin [Cryptosporangium arvum]|uniref:thioredoxin-dependent peroxiredoxin n=1 Tax=Cryptosporangium arvum DSM 44712 TaxID=927661 RepID=A0A010YYU1_9ACTN|nr:peroxiredoxin [Cryptosporangium arvum]EXG80388.1 Peroxiredoxin [Cryptosporangium arvum DSM 44712]